MVRAAEQFGHAHRRTEMRVILAAFIVAASVGTLASSGASAAPANGAAIANASAQTSTVLSVMGGCGRGWHRGPRGGCRRN
jgi:Spy/CpxP family protein refolding chaperone